MVKLLSFAGVCLILCLGPVVQCWLGNGSLPEDVRLERLELDLSQRLLRCFAEDREVARFRVSLGSDPEKPKERQGDGRTPVGEYVIDYRNPGSAFHLSLHISYPDAKDRAHARELGVSPGGDIMIHGLPNKLAFLGSWQGLHRLVDWTKGCVAVTDREMDALWRSVPDGTPITIKP